MKLVSSQFMDKIKTTLHPVKSLLLRKWPSPSCCDGGGSFVFILVVALQPAWTRMPTPTHTSHFSISTSVLIKVTQTYSWKMEKTNSTRQMYQNYCLLSSVETTHWVICKSLKISRSHLPLFKKMRAFIHYLCCPEIGRS